MLRFTDEEIICICGSMSFFPCLRDGTVVEATAAAGWDGISYRCMCCDGLHKNPYFNEDDTPLSKEMVA